MAVRVANLAIGDVVNVELPKRDPEGHEQFGWRPAIIVGLPHKVATPRYMNVTIVPTTGIKSFKNYAWAQRAPLLYVHLAFSWRGLEGESYALLDNVTMLDVERLDRWFGRLSTSEYLPIREGLSKMLGLS